MVVLTKTLSSIFIVDAVYHTFLLRIFYLSVTVHASHVHDPLVPRLCVQDRQIAKILNHA